MQLKTQTWYFVFQVIQVFLVTTLASGAVASVNSIIKKPSDAPTLLATALPTASNFYINYLVLFGLSASAATVCNIVAVLLYTVLGKLLDKTPRKMYNRYIKIAAMGWGSIYPKFTLLGVIGKRDPYVLPQRLRKALSLTCPSFVVLLHCASDPCIRNYRAFPAVHSVPLPDHLRD